MKKKKGRALVGDFGLSRLVYKKIGGILLSWQWIAPECLDSTNISYDEKSDIYSLGMIFYELASISMPFEEYATNPRYFARGTYKLMEIKRAIIDEGLRPSIPEHTPPLFREIMENCWIKDPQKRISTKAIIGKLLRLLGDSYLPLPNIERPLISKHHQIPPQPPLAIPSIICNRDSSSSEKFTTSIIFPVEHNLLWTGLSHGSIEIFIIVCFFLFYFPPFLSSLFSLFLSSLLLISAGWRLFTITSANVCHRIKSWF